MLGTTDMPEPINQKELQRFLGMITYQGKSLPNLSTKTASLRLHQEKDTIRPLDKTQRDVFQDLKEMITQSPTLKYFDPKLHIKVSSDESTQGLGVRREQLNENERHPIAYASRSLTSTEINNNPIELEILSILFACPNFREYVYGQRLILHNGYKPHKSIMSKQITKAPPRIQPFLLRLQKYGFDLEYTKSQLMKITDTINRDALQDKTPEISDKEMNYFILFVMLSHSIN